MSLGGDPIPVVLQAFEGLSTIRSPEVRQGGIRPTQAVLLENLDVSLEDIQVRKGYKKLRVNKLDGSRPVIGNWRAYKGTTGAKKQILQTRNKLWTLSGSSLASITGSAVTITSGWAHTAVSYQDVFYGTNGVNPWWQWTFAAKLTAPTAPAENYKYMCVFEEKIVMGRGATNKDKVTWSDEGLPTTFQVLNFIFYPPDRSDDLTMMAPLNGEIIMATRLRIGKTVGGLPPRAVIDISLGVGCVSHYSAAYVTGWLYFVGMAGKVYRTDGNVVQDLTQDLDTSDIDISNDVMLRGTARDNRYYDLSYRSKATGTGFPNRILTYDTLDGQWIGGPHKVMRAATWCEYRAAGDDGRIVGGTPSGHAVLYWSGSSDAGSKITGIWKGGVFKGADPSFRVGFEEMEIQGQAIASGSATLAIFVDRAATASTVGTVSLKTTGPIEGQRDATSVSRTWVYAPDKVKFTQSARQFQPQVTIAQKSGRGRVSMVRFVTRQIKYK